MAANHGNSLGSASSPPMIRFTIMSEPQSTGSSGCRNIGDLNERICVGFTGCGLLDSLLSLFLDGWLVRSGGQHTIGFLSTKPHVLFCRKLSIGGLEISFSRMSFTIVSQLWMSRHVPPSFCGVMHEEDSVTK